MRGERSYQAGVETSLGRFVTMGCDGSLQVGRGRGPGRGRGGLGGFEGFMVFLLAMDERGGVTTLMRGGDS